VIPTALLRQQLTIRRREGEGAVGPVFAGEVTYGARVEAKRRRVRDGSGTLFTGEAIAWLRPDAPVEVGDMALLDGRELTVLAVTELRSLSHPLVLELVLGEAGGGSRQ
jgi:hypothetical protein